MGVSTNFKLKFLSLIPILIFAFAFLYAAACQQQVSPGNEDETVGGQKDEDDIDPVCSDTCYNLFECGGSLWFINEEECLFWCDDWLLSNQQCADCMVGCWYVDEKNQEKKGSPSLIDDDDDDNNDNDSQPPPAIDCDEAIDCMEECVISEC